jgi:hypothetical protein
MTFDILRSADPEYPDLGSVTFQEMRRALLDCKRSFLTVPFKMLAAVRVSQRCVDLVGEGVFGERFFNRQIETCEQLG